MDSNYIHRTVVVVAGRRHLVGRPARRQYRRTQDDDDDVIESAEDPSYLLFRERGDRAEVPVATGNKRPRAAASSMAILGLQEVTPSNALQSECAVCLQDFDPEETLRAMPCSHAFHQQCISDWLRRNGVCPLCRHELPTHQQE
ncbi:unnamed protein product [Urochloa decumbens]|uniref:RING-type domain-containing protein n=1 Tax=Urochloa decumbens TaxID=240449 RepID=A0ABC9H943_9POAL